MTKAKRRATPATKTAAQLPKWIDEEAFHLPKWVSETPTVEYQLAVLDDGSDIEFVSLSRVEYIVLKTTLAKMRGYPAA